MHLSRSLGFAWSHPTLSSLSSKTKRSLSVSRAVKTTIGSFLRSISALRTFQDEKHKPCHCSQRTSSGKHDKFFEASVLWTGPSPNSDNVIRQNASGSVCFLHGRCVFPSIVWFHFPSLSIAAALVEQVSASHISHFLHCKSSFQSIAWQISRV